MFKEPIENKAMTGHVIRSEEVPNQGTCRLMCYMEPNCVSINFGPSKGGKCKCELNSATDENKLTFLHDKKSYTFLAIEVNVLIAKLSLFIVTMFELEIQNHIEGFRMHEMLLNA